MNARQRRKQRRRKLKELGPGWHVSSIAIQLTLREQALLYQEQMSLVELLEKFPEILWRAKEYHYSYTPPRP